MKLHRFTLKPASPWGGRLRGDTLAGLLLWRIAERKGARACADAIAAFKAGHPPFVVSGAMPAGFLPMPCLPPIPRDLFRERMAKGQGSSLLDSLRQHKKFRKNPWLPLEAWRQKAACLDMLQLFEHNSARTQAAAYKTEDEGWEPHVSLDRQNSAPVTGALFFTRLRYFDKAAFHIYARVDDADWLWSLLAEIGELGFGKDASTGKGRFEASHDADFNGAELEHVPGANAWLLLSDLAAPDMSGLDGWYKLESRNCKAGPGMGSPFKDPFLCVLAGAVLRSLPKGPYVLENINPNPAVTQILVPLALPCKLEREE